MLPHTLLPVLFCTVAYFLGQRWVRFGIVGVLATLAYFVPAVLLDRAGLPVFVTNTLSYVVGFGMSYTGHRTWTFQSKANHGSVFPKFLATQVFGFALNTFIVWLSMYMGLTYVSAMTIAIVCVPAISYTISKFWVFRDPAAYIPKVPRAPSAPNASDVPSAPGAPDAEVVSPAAPRPPSTPQENEVN